MADKWSIKPVLADKMADILVFLADKEVSTSIAISQGVGIATTRAKKTNKAVTDKVKFAPGNIGAVCVNKQNDKE